MALACVPLSLLAACTGASSSTPSSSTGSAAVAAAVSAPAAGSSAGSAAAVSSGDAVPGDLPAAITAIMDKPRYANASWSLLVKDIDSGESFYALSADKLALTGSTRKLFSVGAALDALGTDHRRVTPVHRQGTVSNGVLTGDLILVAGGDLEFGGRRIDADTVQYRPKTQAFTVTSSVSSAADGTKGKVTRSKEG